MTALELHLDTGFGCAFSHFARDGLLLVQVDKGATSVHAPLCPCPDGHIPYRQPKLSMVPCIISLARAKPPISVDSG
jgi:hypothetical protein